MKFVGEDIYLEEDESLEEIGPISQGLVKIFGVSLLDFGKPLVTASGAPDPEAVVFTMAVLQYIAPKYAQQEFAEWLVIKNAQLAAKAARDIMQ